MQIDGDPDPTFQFDGDPCGSGPRSETPVVTIKAMNYILGK